MNAVVTVQVVAFSTGRWQSTVTAVTDIVLSPFRRVAGSFDCTLARQLGFHDNLWMFFAYTTFDVGITVMLTRVSKEWQWIRTVWVISRDDRARIAICSLSLSYKDNYSIIFMFTSWSKVTSWISRASESCQITSRIMSMMIMIPMNITRWMSVMGYTNKSYSC